MRSTSVDGFGTAVGAAAIFVGNRDPDVGGAAVPGGAPTNENASSAPVVTAWERLGRALTTVQAARGSPSPIP